MPKVTVTGNTDEGPSSGFIKPDEVLNTDRFTDFSTVTSRGFSQLTRAKRHGRWWMLKGLKEQYREDAVYRALLQKEYEITSQLQHPMVVSAFSFEDVEGLGPCIVMEWIEGVTLREWLSQGSHTRKQRRHVADMLTEALAYVHSRQTQHRDLKPSNIMLTHEGHNLKLIDFGLSDTDSHAILKESVGTAGYVAPEGPSDIYSLGCILRELRTGCMSGRVVRKCCASLDRRYTNVATVQRDLHRCWHWTPWALLIASLAILPAAIYLTPLIYRSLSLITHPSSLTPAPTVQDDLQSPHLPPLTPDSIISFADEKVKAICVDHWDTNGDGELNMGEAYAVTDLGEVFKENEAITSFDELQYFTGLTNVGKCAFLNCSRLISVKIPNSVTSIEEWAFNGCTVLKSIFIPANVKSIYYSFNACVFMEQIIVDPENTVYDSRNGCNAIIETATNKLIAGCQATQIPDGIETIGVAAFEGRWAMKEMAIPETVTSIEHSAFNWCDGLTSITLPASVSTIDWGAFDNCNSLTTVRCNMKTPPTIIDNVFSNRTNATLYVPKGCRTAYEAADYWKEFNTVKEFTPSSSITFADPKVKAICGAHWDTNGDGELSRAEAAAVTSLGDVFKGNTQITSFDELQFFTGLIIIGDDAFRGCSGLASVKIPNSVTSIGEWSFDGCSGLTSILIPANVTNIYGNSFVSCAVMEQMSVDPSNTVYDSRNGCNAIIETATNKLVVGCQTTQIPYGITAIGDAAFWGRWGIKQIVISETVTTIGVNAFIFCTSLSSITLPASVSSIGNGAFNSCRKLVCVQCKMKTPPAITEDVFSNRANATLLVPKGSRHRYETADYWKEFKEIKEF